MTPKRFPLQEETAISKQLPSPKEQREGESQKCTKHHHIIHRGGEKS
jgi:hypothetical protein